MNFSPKKAANKTKASGQMGHSVTLHRQSVCFYQNFNVCRVHPTIILFIVWGDALLKVCCWR